MAVLKSTELLTSSSLRQSINCPCQLIQVHSFKKEKDHQGTPECQGRNDVYGGGVKGSRREGGRAVSVMGD